MISKSRQAITTPCERDLVLGWLSHLRNNFLNPDSLTTPKRKDKEHGCGPLRGTQLANKLLQHIYHYIWLRFLDCNWFVWTKTLPCFSHKGALYIAIYIYVFIYCFFYILLFFMSCQETYKFFFFSICHVKKPINSYCFLYVMSKTL